MASLRRLWPVDALALWTFVVWTVRIDNIWDDDDLDTTGKVGRTALALSFTLLMVAVVAALGRARRRDRLDWLRPTVVALAAWTIAVWAVRGPAILLGDHDTSFEVVHAILAVVSITLAVLAWRACSPATGLAEADGPEPSPSPSAPSSAPR